MEEPTQSKRTKETSFVTATAIARELGCDRRRIARLLLAIKHQLPSAPVPMLVMNGRRLYLRTLALSYLRGRGDVRS